MRSQAKDAVAKVKELEQQLGTLQKEEPDLQQNMNDASGKYHRTQGELEALKKSMPAESQAVIRAQINNAESVAIGAKDKLEKLRAARSSAESDKSAAVERVNGAIKNADDAKQKDSIAEQQLLLAMIEHHFADETALAEMLTLSQKEVSRRRDQLTRWEADRESHIRELADLEQELEGKSDIDPEGIRAQIDAVQQSINSLGDRLQSLRRAMQSNQSALERTKTAMEEWSKAQEKAQFFSVLYTTAIGPKGKNQTFEVYIQRYYFKYVVDLANLRFRPMTGNMFELRLNQSNLDLKVMDYHTGKERPVGTLSGGEKFKAALSMALGMSDMVQSEIPDIQLGMLFIDEGFGTLDSGSIDLAIDILRQLSNDSGRLIAVISHREEMQAGIEQKIVVKKHKESDREKGSYLEKL